MVTRAKDEGGLGVLDLQIQNEALLIKNLHKFFNRINIPSVKLIWEKYYSNGNLPNHAKKGVLLVEGHPKTPRQIQRHGLDFSSEWGHPAFFGMISGLGLCRSMLFLNSIPSQKKIQA
jgi:hypothetical protein